jgi:transaldolase
MIDCDGVCGITSNPTIFMNAVSNSSDYNDEIQNLVKLGKDAKEIYHHITIHDIKDAAQMFLRIFKETNGQDGFVSIELNPQNAFKPEESIKEARKIVSEIGLPNIMVKVPGTEQGISAVRQLISEGFNVNITLLFSPECYRKVAIAYIEGLEERAGMGNDISKTYSVASFFLSRIDTKVDLQIDKIAESNADLRQKVLSIRGKTAINVAKVTYGIYETIFFSQRFKKLQKDGANLQRPLWASTGTKDPSYSDVKYVEGLIASGTVNTLPPKTIAAFRDHGVVKQTMVNNLNEAVETLSKIESFGIDLNKIYDQLQEEGVKAFEKSYLDLLQLIEEKIKSLG